MAHFIVSTVIGAKIVKNGTDDAVRAKKVNLFTFFMSREEEKPT